jgi:serine/threonine-protein kinase
LGEGKRFGRFEIFSLLGRGGMAEVYRGRILEGPGEGWPVAIKRLSPALATDPASVAQFTHEGALASRLEHPNIVKVLETGEIGGVSFLAMELIDGRDLGQILKRCQARGIPLPVDFAVYLGQVLLEALAYAHQALGEDGEPLGLVHCDVSPSNLFISRVGEIKLGDFGVARARVGGPNPEEITGKPFYLSPELLAGEVTYEADLWAATVTLYELLTLRRPFTGENPEEVFEAIRMRAYPPLRTLRPEIPEALEQVIARGFAVDRAARFLSAEAYAEALAPLYDQNIGTPLAIAAVVRGLFGAARAE